jgi:hypothetical protein
MRLQNKNKEKTLDEICDHTHAHTQGFHKSKMCQLTVEYETGHNQKNPTTLNDITNITNSQ